MGYSKIWIYLILANLFWAGNFLFGSLIVNEISPFWITFLRWTLAAVLLLPTAYFFEKPHWSTIKNEWFYLALMGVLGIAGYNIILMAALEYTSAANAAVVSALNPGIIVLFSFIFLGEKLSKLQFSGLIISIFGVMVILTKGNINDFFLISYNKGDLFIIITVVLWTFYSIIGKKLTTPPITATAVSTLFSVLLLLPFTFVVDRGISNVSPLSIIGLIYMVIFSSVLSTVLWNISVRGIGVNKSGISMNLTPFFTVLLTIVLGEEIIKEQIIGGIFVLFGVYLTSGLLDQRFKIMKENKQMQKY
ncbi:DMT family transporter [Neobacillus niacini]|uniref:DMT family transporter n=1 Tax=Neobacillus niacini TaxID=86668 RepID=UPI002FFDDBFE